MYFHTYIFIHVHTVFKYVCMYASVYVFLLVDTHIFAVCVCIYIRSMYFLEFEF